MEELIVNLKTAKALGLNVPLTSSARVRSVGGIWRIGNGAFDGSRAAGIS
jgi:hypothetical protein